jgi:hypothetical protein
MRFAIASVALAAGTASASYGYGYPPAPPAVNSTTAVETPAYTPSSSEAPVYVTKTVSGTFF